MADVAAPPPGAFTVRDDAGAVIVRVGGMTGMVKVQVG